jgi:hypothetical protein
MVSPHGARVTPSPSGQRPPGWVLFQLPAFVGKSRTPARAWSIRTLAPSPLAPSVRTGTGQLKHQEKLTSVR